MEKGLSLPQVKKETLGRVNGEFKGEVVIEKKSLRRATS